MKKKKYTHIKKAERLEIAILLKKGYSVRNIAGALKRSHGSISEEIKNNSVRGIYDPDKANHKAHVKRLYSKYQGMKVNDNRVLENYVEEKIKEDWTPELIAGRIKKVDGHIPYASRQAIYKYINSVYGQRLEKYLPRKGKSKRGRKKRSKTEKLSDRTFIENRPKITEKRGRFGDWEGDFIVSGKNGRDALLVLYERKTRYMFISKIMSRKADDVNRRIKELTGGMVCFRTLTLDNDISFSKHKALSKILGAPIFFCHPYHSWEKGGVENANQLIRRYIKKGSDISKFSDAYIMEIQNRLNQRPRKCLDFKTPEEIMTENKQFKSIELNKIFLQNKIPQAVRLEGCM